MLLYCKSFCTLAEFDGTVPASLSKKRYSFKLNAIFLVMRPISRLAKAAGDPIGGLALRRNREETHSGGSRWRSGHRSRCPHPGDEERTPQPASPRLGKCLTATRGGCQCRAAGLPEGFVSAMLRPHGGGGGLVSVLPRWPPGGGVGVSAAPRGTQGVLSVTRRWLPGGGGAYLLPLKKKNPPAATAKHQSRTTSCHIKAVFVQKSILPWSSSLAYICHETFPEPYLPVLCTLLI